ncbi:MAG: hypothetical protein QW176_00960 [Candidatus Bathyarchaeia archaeon]
MGGLMGRLRDPRVRGLLYPAVIILALIFKVLLSMVAVASYDFRTTVQLALRPPEPHFTSPWTTLLRLIYLGWDRLSPGKVDLGSWITGRAVPILNSNFLSLVFLLKLPIIILDLACGYLIYLLALEMFGEGWGLKSYALWMANPYVILMGEMDGSNDLLPILFILITLLLYARGKRYSCSIPLWAGISTKFYPLFIGIVLAVLSRREGKVREALAYIGASAAGLATYFYLVGRWSLRSISSLIYYTPVTFLVSEIVLTSKTVNVGLATATLCVFLYLIHRFWREGRDTALNSTLSLLMAYSAFLNWFPPYLMAAIPLLTLKGVKDKGWLRSMAYWLLTAFLIQILTLDLVTKNSLFYVYNHGAWMEKASSTLHNISGDTTVTWVVKPSLRSIFAALSLFYAAKLLAPGSPTSTPEAEEK